MRKSIIAHVMILCTVLCIVGMSRQEDEKTVEAHIVTVQRGDVHQVVAVSGRLTYADESYVYAASNGSISRFCVEEGQRVAAGEALVRFDSDQYADVVSAFLAGTAELEAGSPMEWIEERAITNTVIRAHEDSTVRQLLVEPNIPVAAGTPILRMTSGRQEIICNVVRVDAQKLAPDMWAWISFAGDSLGFAEVVSVGKLTADVLTGTITATVTLRPEQHIDLPEGAVVDADIYLCGSDDVLTLPVEAITARNTVWWVNEGRCTEIPAQVIMTDETLAWVALPEGLQIAVGEFEEGQWVVEGKQ